MDCLAESASDGCAAAVAYEGRKNSHLDTKVLCEADGITFLPMVAEAAGGWAPAARQVWTDLASLMAAASGESVHACLSTVLQHVGLTLQKENARAILRRGAASADDSLGSGIDFV
jgi:hypothetical protein